MITNKHHPPPLQMSNDSYNNDISTNTYSTTNHVSTLDRTTTTYPDCDERMPMKACKKNMDTYKDIYNNDTEQDEDCCDLANIYRYKFTPQFTSQLYIFSKTHQYDHRHDFKEAWQVWADNNIDMVEEEMRRLMEMGYTGDINDKMFKSARYYFRKKSTVKKEPSKRKLYVSSSKPLLAAMDDHIKLSMTAEENFKPSTGFDEFCKQHVSLIKEQVLTLSRAGVTNSAEIKGKIKKTYKNRYFLAKCK